MNVKQAFTRKFGPLPAWAWLALFGVGVYAYRRMKGGGGSSSSTAVPIDPGVGAGAADLASTAPTSDQLTPQGAPGNITVNIPGQDPNAAGDQGGGNDAGDGDGDGTVEHDPTTGKTTARKGHHPTKPTRPKKTTGKKRGIFRKKKPPELISEHGKGQNHLPAPKGHQPQPAVRHGKTRKPPTPYRTRTPATGGGHGRPAPHPKPPVKPPHSSRGGSHGGRPTTSKRPRGR